MQPLRVTCIDDGMVASIEKVLQNRSEQENELRTLFESALHCAGTSVNELLSDYRQERLRGVHVHIIFIAVNCSAQLRLWLVKVN